MRRFAFSLQKILEIRRHAERQWELRLAEITARVVGVDREVENLTDARSESSSSHTYVGRVDMETLASRERYVVAIDRRVADLKQKRVQLEREREKIRQGYQEASSARKALDKLRERRSSEYYKEALKEEERAIDDINNSQQVRRMENWEENDV
jgi:flagellar FliJ protein